MVMETQSLINKIVIFLIINIILLFVLYSIPINNIPLFDNICLYKSIFGIECWNCGMTRAFLYTLHLDFETAIKFNSNVIFVFPITILVYLYSWYKYIFKKNK